MRTAHVLPLATALSLLAFASCQTGFSNADAAAAQKVEMQMTSSGAISEVEYHIDPAMVPEAVHAAMKALYADAEVIAAEKEYNGGKLYYELAANVEGHKVEAMFLPDGTLHEEEVEVTPTVVPAAVKDAVANRYGDGTVTSWEEIRDAHGATVEWHVKLTRDGKNLKILYATDGKQRAAYRETEAEIEVPIQ